MGFYSGCVSFRVFVLNHNETIAIIEQVLEQIRPTLLNDGGNIELVKFENQIVYVRLLGACVQCPVSLFTLKFGVEEALKEKLPDIKEVIAVD